MGIFTRLILLVGSFVVAYFILKYREQLVRMVGKNYYAERFLGSGGTYNMWILLAVLLVIVAVWRLV